MGKKKRLARAEIQNATPEVAEKPDYRLYLLVCAVLVVITLIPYFQCLSHDFIADYDDNVYVTDNYAIRGGINAKTISWAFTTFEATNWHPLTWLSLALDYQMNGLNARGYHLTNILFHLANTLLLLLVLTRMTGSLWRSSFVAALFAIHPLHVESVAWVCERKDVLSTFFWLLTMYAYVLYAERPKFVRYLPVFLGLALGLMAKPMLVSLPLVLLMMDYWPLNRVEKVGWGRLVLEKLPLLALSLASCVITYIAQRHGGAVSTLEQLPAAVRAGNAMVSYAAYMVKMIWPAGLAVIYPIVVPQTWQVVSSIAVFIAITALVIRYGRKSRYLLVGWLWYVITLIPVIGLIQVGSQSMADRYTYVTLIGLFVIVAWGVPDLLNREKTSRSSGGANIGLGVAAGVVVLILTFCTYYQAEYWQNGFTLFDHAQKVTTDNYVAFARLAGEYKDQGDLNKEMEYAQESLRINSKYAPAHVALATALYYQNRIPEAIEYNRSALELDPKLSVARSNLGACLTRMNQLGEAEIQLTKALSMNPHNADAYTNLGVVRAKQGKLDEAVKQWKHSAELKPDVSAVHQNLFIALTRLGRYDEARKEMALTQQYGGTPDPATVQILDQAGSRK